MTSTVVLNHLTLEQNQDGSFATIHENEGWQVVFGGQLMAQSLVAASNSVSATKKLVSFQATFAAPAAVSTRINYQVKHIREGKSFSMREVVAWQENVACFRANVSFQTDEPGLEFQRQMPAVAPPNECAQLPEVIAAYQKYYPTHLGEIDPDAPLPAPPVEMRFANINQFLKPSTGPVDQMVWVKFSASIGDEQERHKQVLAYAADQTISHVVAQPHGLGGLNPKLRLVSLDHAMWYHRPFRADAWLLLVRQCQSITAGRALVTGQIFDQAGALVASLTQQALARVAN